jgi:PEP-CTERM motif
MLRSIMIPGVALLAGTLPLQAQAADQVYAFAYDSAAYQVRIAGTLLGSLQADGNTILVTQVLGVPTFNGAPAVAVPYVDSLIDVVSNNAFLSPLVSLNGLRMDFAACTSASCDDGFGIEAGNYGVVYALASFGNLNANAYSPTDWTISAVPETSTWVLMALGLVGMAVRRRTA